MSLGTVAQLVKPEYRNWLALGHALTTVLCQGLRAFINRETRSFYNNLKATLAAVAPCTCVYVPGRRPNQYHDMLTCSWAYHLEAHHLANKPNWRQSDSTKWLDPNLGPWEIAKLFLPDTGGHVVINGAEDMDITGILNLMYWCTHFTIPQHLIKDVRDTRNSKWVHVPDLELTDAEKNIAFDAIENLLKDPNLAHDPDVQKTLKEIGRLKIDSDLHSMEARVLVGFKEVIGKEIANINTQLTNLTEQSTRNKEQQIQLKHQQETLTKALEEVNCTKPSESHLVESVFLLSGFVLGSLSGSLKGLRNRNVATWLMLVLLFHCYVVLDDSSKKDECSINVYSDPWKIKYFDFTDFINTSKAQFIGRQWLYNEMESALEHTSKRGVLITGNPGSGKSAFLSHLLCSPTSNPLIHNRILAHHFCMHFDKTTQDGAAFVRNLANMVAWRFRKYSESIVSNSFVNRVLYEDCPQDPEWCFEQAILVPLTRLQPKPSTPWYIVVDALDECYNDKAEIFNILKSKGRRLPKWLKLIVSSRNVSTIVAGLDELERIDLRMDDQRNIEDVDTYLTVRVFSLRESIVDKVKKSLNILDNDTPTQIIVSSLAEKGHGNFLFVKVVLDLWLTSSENIKWETFPKTLDSIYQLYFERKYASRESFLSLREIFEVLVAAYTPLTIQEMYSLFRLENPTLDLEYEFMPKLDQVSLFLWHGSRDGVIQIHHASLSDWLTSDANKGNIYYVKKQNGHKRLAKYYLQKVEENHLPLKPIEAFHLASHIVEGGLDDLLVEQFLSLPPERVNTTDPVTQTTALHYSAASSNTSVTRILMQHFSKVDCLDKNQLVPSFTAAAMGNLGVLKALFARGANPHYTVSYLDPEIASHARDPVRECKRKKCGYSLLHTAAQEGKVNVVIFLLQNNLSISEVTGSNNTALQLAATNGHLEIVEILKKAGALLEELSLHHSAANGHIAVVQYLLREGVKDSCIPRNLPSTPLNSEENELKSSKLIYAYDNRRLYLHETALHAAVEKSRLSVIQLLLREEQNAINCTNAAGRTPQHEAVHLNNYNALEVLLQSSANLLTTVHCDYLPSSMQYQTRVTGTSKENRCPCGFSPLHIAAMYGYYSIAELLIKYKADVNAGDCTGSTPLHIAACHDISSLVVLLVNRGADINAKSLNGSTPLHSAAACFAKGVFRPLFDLGCDHLATDNEGMTALHYTVEKTNIKGFQYLIDLFVDKPKDWIEYANTTFCEMETLNKVSAEYPWLSTLVELIKVSATKEIDVISILKLEDKKKQNVLDKLEEKANASSLLLGTKGMGGLTLVVSLTPVHFACDVAFREFMKSRTLPLNNPALLPTSFTRVFSKVHISMFTKLNCSSLVLFLGFHLVHTTNTALNVGMDVNCYDDVSGLTPLLVYLRTGGRHISKVLVKHDVEVNIVCGDPFEYSVFHLTSYHKLHYLHYLYEFLLGRNNWQRYLQTENAIFDYFLDIYEERNDSGFFETVRTGDGPLTKAIMTHPSGTKVIDECFDAEGLNALHRAAQGANVVTIRKFLSWGANHLSETEDGLSPLWLSILYAVKYRPYLNLERTSVLTALEVELASLSASEILDHILRNDGTFNVGCNASRSDLTLYHVAASRGMWQFIAHLLSSDKVTGIDVNCSNKDGITPIYLAKFIGGDSCKRYGPWCKVVDVIKSHGGTLQYPTLEAEYFLIFNIFFGKNPSPLFLELTDDEIMALRENCGHDECKKYNISNSDLFRTSDEVDRVHNDCQKKVEKCSCFREECPADIRAKLPHFSFVVFTLGKQLNRKFIFSNIRNEFLNFLSEEIDRLKDLLRTATRPHAEMPCTLSPSQDSYENNTIVNDTCFFKFNRKDLEAEVHRFYRDYKKSLDLVQQHSDEVKSSMVLKGRLPGYLSEMKFALHHFDTTLSCDWREIAIKYVQLSFQVRNLNFWRQAVHETSTVPSVSDFVSERMKNVILQPSEESRRLVLKLTSKQPTETFEYLRILRFKKPPFWKETFHGVGNFG